MEIGVPDGRRGPGALSEAHQRANWKAQDKERGAREARGPSAPAPPGRCLYPSLCVCVCVAA